MIMIYLMISGTNSINDKYDIQDDEWKQLR